MSPGRRARQRGGRWSWIQAAVLAACAMGAIAALGCAALQSKEVAIGCQAADAATTIYAKHIGAIEENPLLPNNNVLVLFKAALIWLIWDKWDDLGEFGRGAMTVISCVPVANNLNVIREQRAINRAAR